MTNLMSHVARNICSALSLCRASLAHSALLTGLLNHFAHSLVGNPWLGSWAGADISPISWPPNNTIKYLVSFFATIAVVMHFTGVSRVVSHFEASPNQKSVQASFDLFNRRGKVLTVSNKAFPGQYVLYLLDSPCLFSHLF